VPNELVVIEGAGHGFPGEQGKQASQELIQWFDEHLAADANADEANANEPAAAR
jgi:hypothetical protein